MIAAADPIRVMVVDDSTVIRGLLGRIIDAQPDMRVACSAPNGRSALDLLRHREVDVVLLDVEMPEMDGLSALPRILELRPGVRVVMASSLTQRGAEVTMKALSLGAADYVPKPSAVHAVRGMEAISAELVEKVRALGRAARRSVALPAPAAPAPRAPAPAPPGGHVLAPAGEGGEPFRVLAVASSTGGPNALAAVLSGLPRDFPLPVLIVQHMPPIFTAALAERLQREAGRPCAEARHGERLLPGHTYVAPGDHHTTVMTAEREPVLRLDSGPPENYCRPSADPMLRSVASVFGPSALALVLTGMGEDGLRGCREVVARGGRVVVQDEATSVVWGMPGAVANAGLASAVLPLDRIAGHLHHLSSAVAV
ncbi:MAG TPA: chemotaxis response regulator protein-glutamate methylesterase [Longimicrobiaceae bacterium]